jgi:predicted phage terminase large subunit-like protein
VSWDIFYRGAHNPDGSLFFPERLTQEFLDQAKKHMGSRFYANQYDNIVVDDADKPFKKEWLRYYDSIPENSYRFIFIDPAISLADEADFTAVVVVAVDEKAHWYVEYAKQHKITPTQLIDLIFQMNERFSPMRIGIEDVAFQKVLVYMAYEEMQRRNIWMPLEGIKPVNDETKQKRILALTPRFEWNLISINHGLQDFEKQFIDYAGERSKHDDILDALASIDAIITKPSEQKEEEILDVPPSHPKYEHYYRLKLQRGDFRNR